MSRNGSIYYQFGEFRFDAERRMLWKNGEAIALPPRATDVLALLVGDHGELVERDRLLQSVWRDAYVEEGNLNNAISALRKVLGNKELIQTVPRRGYRFMADTVELTNPAGPTAAENKSSFTHTAELILEKQTVSHSFVTIGENSAPSRTDAKPFIRPKQKVLTQLAAYAALPVLILTGWIYLQSGQRAASAPGFASFETGEIVLTDFGFGDERAQAIALQPDGKFVVAGWAGDNLATADIAIARYKPDGSLDTTFDGDGKLITRLGEHTDVVYGVAVQPDGKIIAVGTNFTGTRSRQFAVLRYKPDGALDASFDGDGIALFKIGDSEQDTANTVAISGDGAILVAGSALNAVETARSRVLQNDFAIIKLSPSGVLDHTFGKEGKVITDFGRGSDVAYALLQQPDDNIVVAGMTAGDKMQDWGMVRYLEDGSLDSSFGSGGKVVTNFLGEDNIPWSLALQPDGKLIAAGYALKDGTPQFALSRHSPDGSLDNSFGNAGKVTFKINSAGVSREVFVLSDGRIVVAGRAGITGETSFGAAFLSPDGTLLESFSPGAQDTVGKQFVVEVHGAVLSADGALVLAGGTKDGKQGDFALARID